MKKPIFLFLFLFVSFWLSQAQIINKGTLKITSGTSVYFGDDYTNDGTHDNDGDLHLKGDFTNNGTVTSASGTTYFDSSSVATQNLNGTANAAQFYNLTINNTHASVQGLAVADTYNLEVTNAVELTSGKLRLMGEAQLIQTHTGASANSGSGHLLKDQDGAQNSYRYNYWSSPVQNDTGTIYNVTTVLKDGTTPNQWSPTQVDFTTALNGTNGTPIALSTRWMWKYIDSSVNPYNDTDWIQLFDMGTTTPSTGAAISPAQGFIMKGTNAAAAYADTQNYSFEGKPNDGTYTLTISTDKEYLVGNPYPSALDADEFLSDNSGIIDGTLWFWEHWSTDTHVYTDYGAGYIVYTPGSGSIAAVIHDDFQGGSNASTTSQVGALPTAYKIPVSQGFIVRSKSTSGGTITFDNSQRVYKLENTSDNSSVFVRHSNIDSDVDRIRIGYEDPNGRHRFLLLAFTQNATDSYENGFDAEMIDIGSDDMFFTMSDNDRNLPYVIQGVGPFSDDKQYPFTIKVTTFGEHRIMIDALENFSHPVYILDEEVGTTYNITENDFVINLDTGTYADRFKIVFQPQSPLNIANILDNLVTTYYADNEVVIRKDSNVAITQVQIYNSIGQLVYEIADEAVLENNEIRIPFDYSQAAYIIKIQAKEGKGTYKFINY